MHVTRAGLVNFSKMAKAGHARIMSAPNFHMSSNPDGVQRKAGAYRLQPRREPRCVLFKQINLAKSKLASAVFAKSLVEWSRCCLVAFLQEPASSTRGLLENIPPGAQKFAALHPRAAIVATQEVSLWPLPADYMSSDVAACLWKTGDDCFPEIVLISVYADINLNSVPTELERITNYC